MNTVHVFIVAIPVVRKTEIVPLQKRAERRMNLLLRECWNLWEKYLCWGFGWGTVRQDKASKSLWWRPWCKASERGPRRRWASTHHSRRRSAPQRELSPVLPGVEITDRMPTALREMSEMSWIMLEWMLLIKGRHLLYCWNSVYILSHDLSLLTNTERSLC